MIHMEPEVEILPDVWFETRVRGHPVIQHDRDGPAHVQVEDAWEEFETLDEAEYELSNRDQ